jgi:hypothetical protein
MMAGVRIYLTFSLRLPKLHDYIPTRFDAVRAEQQRSEVQIQTNLVTTNCIFLARTSLGSRFEGKQKLMEMADNFLSREPYAVRLLQTLSAYFPQDWS